ncbi:MAG: hypothetical protein IJ787_03695 [Bacilli bacterium]|nr:hypothetical protein [Bacilli bacterium]
MHRPLGQTKLIKIGHYNISMVGDTMTLPCYLTFLLGRQEDGMEPSKPFRLK